MSLTLFYTVYIKKNESTYFILLSVLRISVLKSRLESDVMITEQLRCCYYSFLYPNMDFHFFIQALERLLPKKSKIGIEDIWNQIASSYICNTKFIVFSWEKKCSNILFRLIIVF